MQQCCETAVLSSFSTLYYSVSSVCSLLDEYTQTTTLYIMTRLQTILPPKMPFFVGQKVQISSKNSLKSRSSPISTNFVKNQYFRHDAQFSSFRQFFVKNEIIWSIIMVIVVTKYRIIRGYTTSYAKSPSYYLSVFCLCRNINSIKNSVIW